MAGTMTQDFGPIAFGVIGIDHRHVYHLVQGLLDAGARCAGYVRQGSDPKVQEGMRERFPDVPALDEAEHLLQDPQVQLIVCAAIPAQRADIAVAAMRHGKDVLVDKPGVTTEEQLARVQSMCAQTGRIFSICFSERHIVPAVEHALELVQGGAIGTPIQTLGIGPHRLNAAIRPAWFFDRSQFGGILVDIASHQVDQFLVFTGSSDAQVTHSHVGHYGGQQVHQDFDNFGEIILQTPAHRGYVRVDWFTPDGLPTWGDGRLFVMGSHGSIEIRKYLDIEGRPGTNHLFLADARGTHHIDCSALPLQFFRRFLHDVAHRSETCMRQAHVFKVCELALKAQSLAMKGKAC
jgi:predicted dehydrogenase